MNTFTHRPGGTEARARQDRRPRSAYVTRHVRRRVFFPPSALHVITHITERARAHCCRVHVAIKYIELLEPCESARVRFVRSDTRWPGLPGAVLWRATKNRP